MRILLLGMGFYNYDDEIRKELVKQGHHVEIYNYNPNKYTLINRLGIVGLTTGIIDNHLNSIQKDICDREYDAVLVIVGRLLTPTFLRSLKERQRRARFILYLWDNASRVENLGETREYYDEICSFDPVDCAKYDFRFVPLMYTDEFRFGLCDKRSFDVYSALSLHSDRMRIVDSLLRQDHENHAYYLIINEGRFQHMKNSLIRMCCGKNRETDEDRIVYHAQPIPKAENIANMKRCRALLDIQFMTQVGLTIRSLEALACGLKLITTNESIRYYNFYDPNNILILDRSDPHMDWTFLDKEYRRLEPGIYEQYSISSWCRAVLHGSKRKYLLPDNAYGLTA